MTNNQQVKNPSLFKDKSLVGGEWVEARSGKRFDVVGKTVISSDSSRILTLFQIREVIKSGHPLQTTQPRMLTLQSTLLMRHSRLTRKSIHAPELNGF
jgi:hypothetical protein